MTVFSCTTRLRFRAATLVVVVCALAGVTNRAAADTLRSALYQFEIPTSSAATDPSDAAVFLRVSDAAQIASDPSSANGAQGVALFEFFVAGDRPGLNLSEVRLLDRSRPSPSLSRLRIIAPGGQFRSSSVRPPVAHRTTDASHGGASNEEFVLDVSKSTAGKQIGLVFELAPGETIDTLIDERLGHGEILPQIEVAFETGRPSVHALSAHRVDSGRPPRAPTGRLLTSLPDSASATGRVSHDANIDGWSGLETDHAVRPFSHRLSRNVPEPVLHSALARAPPCPPCTLARLVS